MKRAKSSWQDFLRRGVDLHKQGKIAEAEEFYDKVLKVNPDSGDALNLKGALATGRGRHETALKLFDRASALMPSHPDVHFNRGIALTALSRDDDALAAYAKAVALRPTYGDAHLNTGLIHHKHGRTEDAAAAFRKAAAFSSRDPRGHYNLGICLTALLPKSGAVERAALAAEARTAFETALALDPGSADTLNAFATFHSENGDHLMAARLLETALRIKPSWSDAWNNLGNHYEGLGARVAAVAAFDQALRLEPGNTGAVVNRGLTQLALGRLAEGWEGYARRCDDPRFPSSPRAWPWPAWQGEDLRGKRILLWSDQGIGDEVLYATMVREVADRARECVVECTDRLVPLYRRSFPDLEIVAKLPAVHAALAARAFDVQCAVLDLGRWLRRSLSAFPNRPKLLAADVAAAAVFRAKYLAVAPGRKLVGLSWHSTSPRTGLQKSLPLTTFAPLLTSPELTFVNIQYGNVTKELDDVRAALGTKILRDPHVDSLTDLDTFAAQLAALDMVVTVSNSAAHLAGALGVPTAVFVPDRHKRLWYWFDQGGYSPWYRSVRVFRDSIENTLPQLQQLLNGIRGF